MTSDGDILTSDYASGELFAMERAPDSTNTDSFPRRVSETGLFTSASDHALAPGVLSYSVNAPAWNDGARVERYLGLPGDSRIGFLEINRDAHTWELANGTVVGQTLSLDVVPDEAGQSAVQKRIETRILVRQEDHWLGYTYLWNDEQTDAELVDARGVDITVIVKVDSAPGGSREQLWHVPGRNECMDCN